MSEIKGGENTNFKIVNLIAFLALLFAIISATPMFMMVNHSGVKTDNFTIKPATGIHASAQLTGDPVGGGDFPNVQTRLLGDPVGGGDFPNLQIIEC